MLNGMVGSGGVVVEGAQMVAPAASANGPHRKIDHDVHIDRFFATLKAANPHTMTLLPPAQRRSNHRFMETPCAMIATFVQ